MPTSPPNIAIISNLPTPYRLSFLRRLVSEIPEVRFHNLFTHTNKTAEDTVHNISIDAALNPCLFQQEMLVQEDQNPIRAWKLYRRIIDHIASASIDLVILKGYMDIFRLLLLRRLKHLRIPVLLLADSNIFAVGDHNLAKSIFKRLFIRWVVSRVSGLLLMGVCGKAYYHHYIRNKIPIFMVPYEPDYSLLENCPQPKVTAFQARFSIDPSRRRFFYCGRLAPEKGVLEMLASFIQIADRLPDWDLLIAGMGPLQDAMQAMIPSKLQPRIQFLGMLPMADLVPCYHSCDVLILNSRTEPWAVVINEACACGLAIISTHIVGAACELVKNNINGFIIPPENTAMLAQAMLRISPQERLLAMQKASQNLLRQWRREADPVVGTRESLAYFELIESAVDH